MLISYINSSFLSISRILGWNAEAYAEKRFDFFENSAQTLYVYLIIRLALLFIYTVQAPFYNSITRAEVPMLKRAGLHPP